MSSVKALLKFPSLQGWLIGLVAMSTAVVWSFVVPPMQVPDETAHFAYVQYFAETGLLPKNKPGFFGVSTEEQRILDGLHSYSVQGNREGHPPWDFVDDGLRTIEKDPGKRDDGGTYTPAINNPPLYYLLNAVPYWVSPDSSLLVRLQLMRFFSAFLVGMTALFIFLFLRELLPRSAPSWTVGSLACGLSPVFIFIGSGLNNDNLMFTLSACLFFLIARAFRTGFSWKNALALGLVAGLGLVTKFTILGVMPGVGLAVLFLSLREKADWLGKLKRLAAAAAGVVAPLLLLALLSATVWDRPLLDTSTSSANGVPSSSMTEMASYVWQLYLPKLPFMTEQLGGYPPYDLWFNGFVGRFGWLDYSFSAWVNELALGLVLFLLAVAIAAIWKYRQEILSGRILEWISYIGMAVSLLVLVGMAGYQGHKTGVAFEQPRYLLALLPLWGAFLAIAAKVVGYRSAQVIGAFIVVAAIAHNLFSLLLTIERYYA